VDIREILTAAAMPEELFTRDLEILYTGVRDADVVFGSVASGGEGGDEEDMVVRVRIVTGGMDRKLMIFSN
jgi:hypothetical protein